MTIAFLFAGLLKKRAKAQELNDDFKRACSLKMSGFSLFHSYAQKRERYVISIVMYF
jgi:hypothetical protein